MSLVVVVSIGAVTLLEDESGSYLDETGSDIGEPRELAADLDPDLPEPPDWLTPPPPPTIPTTTTTTLLPPVFPIGTVRFSGPMHSIGEPGQCFSPVSAAAGSTIQRVPCDGSADQQVAVIGSLTRGALQFTDPAYAGLCVSTDPGGSDSAILVACDGAPGQEFNFYYGILTIAFGSTENGNCLASDPAGLKAIPCAGPFATHQFFQF